MSLGLALGFTAPLRSGVQRRAQWCAGGVCGLPQEHVLPPGGCRAPRPASLSCEHYLRTWQALRQRMSVGSGRSTDGGRCAPAHWEQSSEQWP